MKIKLNKSKLEALDILLSMMIRVHKPSNIADRLVHSLVTEVWKKVSIKLTKSVSEYKVRHTLTISDTEAMALHIWYHRYISDDYMDSYQYESLVCRNIVNEIDREYA
jgi:hypothetical protein